MIGIIAGTGVVPAYACRSLKSKNKDFFVISLFPEQNLALLQDAVGANIDIVPQDFCKAQAILDTLKARGTTQVLFIGKVDKGNLFKKLRLDTFALKLLASLVYKSDKAIMERLIQELAHHNMHVIQQSDVLDGLLVKPGILCGQLDSELEANIKLGMHTADALSTYEVGQTVVVKDKAVLAVEGVEGTDACIKRGIELGNGRVIICKSAHATHNAQYDLPTLGPESLTSLKFGQVHALAWNSERTLIVEREKFVSLAKELAITLVSV
ncbi:MAG: UDP-2,3-diacylglucosamine diphosphatase LpxI [Epsilonproteobacteria bacterium]|nr:UDP-2,3-diacylglucosamine diphosphatase LpxI [Campylobacterota bacterium]